MKSLPVLVAVLMAATSDTALAAADVTPLVSRTTGATQAATVRYFNAPKGMAVNDLAPGPNGSAWFVNKSLYERPTRLRIGRITPRGRVTQRTTSITMDRATPASGPNGELWVGWLASRTRRNVTVLHGGLGRAQMDTFTDLAPSTDGDPLNRAMVDVAVASDGAAWYGTSFGGLGRIAQAAGANAGAGRYRNAETTAATSISGLASLSITAGENATVWFAGDGGLLGSAQSYGDEINLTAHDVGTNDDLSGVVMGSDRRIWFFEGGFHGMRTRIGRYDPQTGETRFFPTKPRLDPNSLELVRGPDGNLWYTAESKVVRLTPSGHQRGFSVGRYVTSVTPGLGQSLWVATPPSTSRTKIGRFKIPR